MHFKIKTSWGTSEANLSHHQFWYPLQWVKGLGSLHFSSSCKGSNDNLSEKKGSWRKEIQLSSCFLHNKHKRRACKTHHLRVLKEEIRPHLSLHRKMENLVGSFVQVPSAISSSWAGGKMLWRKPHIRHESSLVNVISVLQNGFPHGGNLRGRYNVGERVSIDILM